jgi:segregation and condensation protein A
MHQGNYVYIIPEKAEVRSSAPRTAILGESHLPAVPHRHRRKKLYAALRFPLPATPHAANCPRPAHQGCNPGALPLGFGPLKTERFAMSEYKVKFEVFEGPLDLLLYLIKKEEVDIYEVNLTKLATQFIEYIDVMRMLDLEIAGEFLVMAATLMYIKSRELLPVDQQVKPEDEDEGEDPRWELIRQLVEYKKFKDAAAQLQSLELAQEQTYPRLPGKIEFAAPSADARPDVSIFDLINAVNSILKRVNKKEDLREIFEDKWTVSEKIEHILNRITSEAVVRFSSLFEDATSRTEVVVTFLALLELIRLKRLVVTQPEPFADIEIGSAPAQAVPTDSIPETVAETPAELESTSPASAPAPEPSAEPAS